MDIFSGSFALRVLNESWLLILGAVVILYAIIPHGKSRAVVIASVCHWGFVVTIGLFAPDMCSPSSFRFVLLAGVSLYLVAFWREHLRMIYASVVLVLVAYIVFFVCIRHTSILYLLHRYVDDGAFSFLHPFGTLLPFLFILALASQMIRIRLPARGSPLTTRHKRRTEDDYCST